MSNVSSSNGLEKYPKLRFRGFSEPFVVRKIGTFAKCYAGATPSTKVRSYWDNGTIPWLSSGEVNKKHIDFTDTYISQSGFDNCSTKMVPSGTVVMALAGQGKTRGTVAITNIDLCTNQSLAAIVTDDSVCDLCLLYYLETQYENLRAVSSGDGTRGGLNLQIISDYPVCLPSIGEQIKIADFFAVLDKKIEKQHTLIETLKKYKRGLVSSILSEKIKISDEAWEECTIGDFLASKSIKQLPTAEAPLMAFTATGGVCDKGERYDRGFLVKDASTKLYKRTDYGDFIYSSNNLDVGSIGLNLYGSAVISDVYEIFSINGADPWFISEVIQQKPIMRDILKYRQGCLYGQYRIYAEDFLSVKIRIPSLPLQSKIGALISQVESKILAEQGLLDNLEKCKAALLQIMFI